MGLSLRNDSGKTFHLENGEWRTFLKVARRYGWNPMRTEPNIEYMHGRAKHPDGGIDDEVLKKMIEGWNGSYLTQEKQFVTYADALNIAFALEEAVKERGMEAEQASHVSGSAYASHLEEFISFCKLGRFSIG